MVLCPPSVSWDIEISPAIQQPGVISMGIRNKVNTADKTMSNTLYFFGQMFKSILVFTFVHTVQIHH